MSAEFMPLTRVQNQIPKESGATHWYLRAPDETVPKSTVACTSYVMQLRDSARWEQVKSRGERMNGFGFFTIITKSE
jgi:hypothetical protein